MENSGEIYLRLLERLRSALPDVAAQIEEEVARGRRVMAETLPASERDDRNLKMRDAGSRMSKEDVALVPYGDDDRLALLVDAVLRLGSSMATSREALAAMLRDNKRPTLVRFVPEDDVSASSELEVATEAQRSRTAFDAVSEGLAQALAEFK